MALLTMENPLLGAPAVAPSTPAWCPGGLTHTKADRECPFSTLSTAWTTPPAALSAAAMVPGLKNVSLNSGFCCVAVGMPLNP